MAEHREPRTTSAPPGELARELRSTEELAAKARGERLASEGREIRSLLDRLVSLSDSLLELELAGRDGQTVESIRETSELLASKMDGILDTPHRAPAAEVTGDVWDAALPAIPISLKILVAEDHLVNRKIVRLMLQSLGLDADFVTNGRDAVTRTLETSYDVILMDLRMPRLNGIEAARQIREARQDGGPRIVAMSAYALQPVREECTRAGIDGFLSKPVQLDELRRLLALAAAAS